jgi:hypothetical protein
VQSFNLRLEPPEPHVDFPPVVVEHQLRKMAAVLINGSCTGVILISFMDNRDELHISKGHMAPSTGILD